MIVHEFFAVGSSPLEKMLVSVRLGQIWLGSLGLVFFLTVNCPTAKNPRALVRYATFYRGELCISAFKV